VAAAVAMAVAAAAEVHLMAPAITEAEATRTTTPPETHVVSMTLTTRSTRSDVKRPLKQATATASPPILQDFTTCFFLRNSNLSDLQVPHEARPSPVAQVFALTIENAGVHKDAKCLFFPFYLDQAPLRWLDSLEKNSIDEWDQLKAQFTSNFVGTMGRSGTRMDLAMVKQEQGETLRQYMWCFFDKSATVVDVTDKKVIDLFQDGLYQRRTFEDFGHHRPSSITKLKDMITSWADEEDKVKTNYDSIRGKSKNNTGDNNNNNNNKDHGGRNNNNYSGPNRKRKPDNTVVAIQHPAKENSKKTSGGFKDLLKEKCPWHLDDNHTTKQCYQLR
jgi:hypothetical protein